MKCFLELSRLRILFLITIVSFVFPTIITYFEIRDTYGQTSSSDFNFAAVGDFGCTSGTRDTLDEIENKEPELILALGDLSYEDTGDCWLEIVEPVDENVKIAIGNHELSAPLLKQYMDHFGMAEQYYSFDHRSVHFLALSTYVPFEAGSEQYKFVYNDLLRVQTDPEIKWIIVFYHTTAYTSPSVEKSIAPEYAFVKAYHQLFERYHVDLVLQGHNHAYERSYPIIYNNTDPTNPVISDMCSDNYSDPIGQIFATVGTGGRGLFSFEGKAHYIVNQYVGFGYLNVEVAENGTLLSATFYGNDGSPKDSFTIEKPEVSDPTNEALPASCNRTH